MKKQIRDVVIGILLTATSGFSQGMDPHANSNPGNTVVPKEYGVPASSNRPSKETSRISLNSVNGISYDYLNDLSLALEDLDLSIEVFGLNYDRYHGHARTTLVELRGIKQGNLDLFYVIPEQESYSMRIVVRLPCKDADSEPNMCKPQISAKELSKNISSFLSKN